ncbi:hypothetical protein B0H14DRAFT_262244 [Mycena olivaceomarginata]|nr:hypothetical protein B0H14DRAFT_262244 [Mycena olivaceomarginata]
MDLDIDIEGEDAPRVRASSAASLHPSMTPPRSGSSSPFAASSFRHRPLPIPLPRHLSSLSPHHLHTPHLSTTPLHHTSHQIHILVVFQNHAVLKLKRLAGLGVPPPSPKAPAARWGPLIGAARGVRAVERERGSGGWGRARSRVGARCGGGIFRIRVRDDGGAFWGWVWGAVCEWQIYRTSISLPGRRSQPRGSVPESVCPPKMRKRWKADVPAPTYGPPRVDKHKEKAPVQEEAKDVNVYRYRRRRAYLHHPRLPRCAPTASMLSLPTRATAAAWNLCGSLA